MKRLFKYLLILVAGAIVFTACEDKLDTKPTSTVSQGQIDELAELDPDAIADILEPQIAGMYGFLVAYNSLGLSSSDVRHDDFGITGILHIADMMGEDIVQTSGSYGWYWYDYLLDSKDKDLLHPRHVWQYFYQMIKMANDIIVQVPEGTDSDILKAYKGQSLAMRAYCYHYLVQFFQKGYIGHENDPAVPLVLEVVSEEGTPRASMSDVYSQMVDDLVEAVDLLDGYARPSKGFIDQSVANGVLARVYLSMEEWDLAAQAANSARVGYDLMQGEDYLDGFKYITNPEWMFGSIVTVDLDIVTSGIINFPSFISSFSYGYAALTGMHKAIDRRLYDHMGDSDIRKSAYQAPDFSTFPDGGYNEIDIPAYVNGKFGASDDGADNTQDYVYMRAAEMLLIEAEALAAQGNTAAAGQLLEELMANRDPDYSLPADVLEEVRIQRRIELWGEIGIALFDIKRLGLGINRAYDGSNHPDEAKLVVAPEDWLFTYQIPTSEIDNNTDIDPGDNNP